MATQFRAVSVASVVTAGVGGLGLAFFAGRLFAIAFFVGVVFFFAGADLLFAGFGLDHFSED